MSLAQTAYLPLWFLRSRILGQRRPLQTVLFITDCCNLRCAHCTPSGHAGTRMKPYEEIEEELRWSYAQGSRFVDLEGGEPTLWRDGARTLNDLYDLAKAIGFFSGTLTTNGQQPFGDTHADSVWVSVDGFEDYHDKVRGEGTFARLDENIRSCAHGAVSIAMAVNRLNLPSLADTVRYARSNPAIQSIAVNFHTPFPGTEALTLTDEERRGAVACLLDLKQQGYPIMNSASGLRLMAQGGYAKDCWVANYILIDGRRIPQCPGKLLGVCDQCGFSMSAEMYCVLRLKGDTLRSGLNLRLGEKRGGGHE